MNIKKAKFTKVSIRGDGEISVTIDVERLEQVDRFRDLGALIASNGRCEPEIKTRIFMAKNAINQRKELLSKILNKDIKKRIIKSIIRSVALYTAETWTFKKEDYPETGGFLDVGVEEDVKDHLERLENK